MRPQDMLKLLPKGPRTPDSEIDWLSLYKTVLDNMNGSIFIIDQNANVLYCNGVGAHMMAHTVDEVVQMSMQDILINNLAEDSGGVRALITHEPVDTYIRNSRGEGMLIHSVPLNFQDGKPAFAATYSWYEESTREFWERAAADSNIALDALKFINRYVEPAQTTAASENAHMQEIYSVARAVAGTDGSVLLLGESGVGKEVIARYIHKNSPRSSNVFIPVNCAAIPPNLFESEFFGYTKGAFTGALKEGKAGLFEMANGGTLFLDEVGELPLDIQSKLLRVLEDGEVRRLGSNTESHVDVRIISATNRNLRQMVDEHLFRLDLYYRLSIIPISIPPLRERREDILALSEQFLNEFNRKYGTDKPFSGDLKQMLLNYSWPGNIRELRNVIERLVIISRSDSKPEIYPDSYFQFAIPDQMLEPAAPERQPAPEPASAGGGPRPLREAAQEWEYRYIRQVLALCGGNVARAAEKMGIHRTVLYAKIRKYKELYPHGLPD